MTMTQIRRTVIGFVVFLLIFPLYAIPAFAGTSDTNFFADMRFRHESDFEQVTLAGVDKGDRHRERVRLRFGANHELTNEFTLGLRIVSGNPDDPNSPHQNLGNAFHSFELSFDRFFVNYYPEWLPGFSFTGGKFAHPFQKNPVYGDLVWDVDVQPEGAFIAYEASDIGPLEKINLVLGEYLVKENDTNDMNAFVAQVSVLIPLGAHLKTSVAVAYYGYNNFSKGGATTACDNRGNATSGVKTTDCDGDGTKETAPFASEFKIINPYVALLYEGSAYPMVMSVEYINNTGANISKDSGWLVGVAVGSTRQKGNLRLYYVRAVVEQDAVLTLTSQDDFLFQTNHDSHRLGVQYRVSDDVVAHPYVAISEFENGGPSDSQWRARLDLDITIN